MAGRMEYEASPEDRVGGFEGILARRMQAHKAPRRLHQKISVWRMRQVHKLWSQVIYGRWMTELISGITVL